MRGVFARRRRPAVLKGYRHILVAVERGPATERAIDVACRLAAERGASITALVVLEIPALLPLDAHLSDEEDAARRLLERVAKTADQFDVRVSAEIVRARDAGSAIVRRAVEQGVEVIVIGDSGTRLRSTRAVVLGPTVEHVLHDAPCRVLVISAAPKAAGAGWGDDTVAPIQAAPTWAGGG